MSVVRYGFKYLGDEGRYVFGEKDDGEYVHYSYYEVLEERLADFVRRARGIAVDLDQLGYFHAQIKKATEFIRDLAASGQDVICDEIQPSIVMATGFEHGVLPNLVDDDAECGEKAEEGEDGR